MFMPTDRLYKYRLSDLLLKHVVKSAEERCERIEGKSISMSVVMATNSVPGVAAPALG